MSTQAQHIPVLMREAVDALNIQGRGVFVDATFGRGGHTAEILKLLGSDGVLFALDRDPTAIALAEQVVCLLSRRAGPISQLTLEPL